MIPDNQEPLSNFVKSNLTTPGGWSPLSKTARGIAVRCFEPTPEQQKRFSLVNVYLGDEVFIFELHSGLKWARAHVISAPKAQSAFLQNRSHQSHFSNALSPPLTPLDMNFSTGIVPVSHVLIKEYFEVTGFAPSERNSIKVVENAINKESKYRTSLDTSSYRYSEITTSELIDFESVTTGFSSLTSTAVASGKPHPPPAPYLRLGNETPIVQNEPLVDDISSVIKEWFYTYLYRNYIDGNYSLVSTIFEVISDLYTIRRKLLYDALTQQERILARRRALWQIDRVTKLLKRGIIARDPQTGVILGTEVGPVRLAQEQFIYGLSPNYPDHAVTEIKKFVTNLPKHILVDFKSVAGKVGLGKMYVHLYLRTKATVITEPFMISIDPHTSLGDLSSVLFKDLPLSITNDDVFLVAEVYEDVSVKKSVENNDTNHTLVSLNGDQMEKKSGKRGVAAGVADISRLFRMEKMTEAPFTLRMYANYLMDNEPNNENGGWGELVERIIRGRPKGVAVTPRAESVTCIVKEFEPNGLSTARKQEKAVNSANSLSITSVSLPRNDVYVRFGKVSLSENIKKDRKRDLILISAISISRRSIFTHAANNTPTDSWLSSAAYDEEVIGDVARLTDFTAKDNLELKLYIAGMRAAGATLTLTQGNRIISGKKDLEFIHSDSKNVIATVQIVVDFIGNGFNVDTSIEKILQWKSTFEGSDTEKLIYNLKLFQTINEQEYIKKFHGIMDAILDMMSFFHDDEKMQTHLFNALIITLDKVTSRDNNYTFLIEDYFTDRFNFGGLSELLLTLFEKKLIEKKQGSTHSLVSLFRVSRHISTLATCSGRIDFDRDEDAKGYLASKCAGKLKKITDIIREMLVSQEKENHELFMSISQNIYKFFLNLQEIVDDVGRYLIDVVDSLQPTNDRQRVQRLLLIRAISLSELFQTSKYKTSIVSYIIKWTLPIWILEEEYTNNTKEQVRLVAGIFAQQLADVWEKRDSEKDACKKFVPMLPLAAKLFLKLLDVFESSKKGSSSVYTELFPANYPYQPQATDSVINVAYDEALIEISVVFTMLVNIAHYSGEHLTDSKFSKEQFTQLAFNVIRACNALLDCSAFPKSWVSLLGAQHDTVLRCLEYLGSLMIEKFIPAPEEADVFNSELWYSYIRCVLKLASSELMAVEKLPEQKRAAIWKITKDLRGKAALLAERMWTAIGWTVHEEERIRFGVEVYGGYQVQLYGGETSLVYNVLELCLSSHRTTQKIAIEILYSMIIGEWTLNSDFAGLQKEVVISLDEIFQTRAFIPETYEKEVFVQSLREMITVDSADEAFSPIVKLVNDIDDFLDLLIDLYCTPSGDAYNDDRVFHALNVLNFLKDIDRVEIFSRYVSDIAQWNKMKSNFAQTGLAYRLMASGYEWSYSTTVEANDTLHLPSQSAFERKVALYEKAIEYFKLGKAYENGIEATKDLINAYEKFALDFRHLVDYSNTLSKFYAEVENSNRVSAQYFRVVYMGKGFPRSLQERQFIFEGTPWDKLETIHERLNKLYPSAKIVSGEDFFRAEGQYLHISSVVPEPSETLLSLPHCSPGAREFHTRQNMRFFSFSRRLSGGTSPLDTWTEKTTFETYQSFPSIVKRSEIKQSTVLKLSPLQNAVDTLDAKINDLAELESQFTAGRANQGTISKLNLILSGSIDSPVNGGIQIYRNFLGDDSLKMDHEQGQLIQILEAAFLDYTCTIERCLAIHAKVVTASLKPLHNSLVQLFERNFSPELALLAAENTHSTSTTADSNALSIRRLPSYNSSRISLNMSRTSRVTTESVLSRPVVSNGTGTGTGVGRRTSSETIQSTVSSLSYAKKIPSTGTGHHKVGSISTQGSLSPSLKRIPEPKVLNVEI